MDFIKYRSGLTKSIIVGLGERKIRKQERGISKESEDGIDISVDFGKAKEMKKLQTQTYY